MQQAMCLTFLQPFMPLTRHKPLGGSLDSSSREREGRGQGAQVNFSQGISNIFRCGSNKKRKKNATIYVAQRSVVSGGWRGGIASGVVTKGWEEFRGCCVGSAGNAAANIIVH